MQRGLDKEKLQEATSIVSRMEAALDKAQIQIDTDRAYSPSWRLWQGITLAASLPKKIFWDYSNCSLAPLGAAALGYAISSDPTGILSTATSNLTAFLFAASSIDLASHRFLYPKAKATAHQLHLKVAQTRPYRLAACSISAAASHIPSWEGTLTTASNIGRASKELHLLAVELVNYPRQVMA